MILKVPFVPQNNPKECAITCLKMVFSYMKKEFPEKKMQKTVKANRWGYNLIEVAEFLINQKMKVEMGHFDQDLIHKKEFAHFPIKLKELEKYLHSRKVAQKMKKYPNVLKIQPVSLGILESFLKINKPPIIHLDVSSYFDKTDESIHSVLVIGKTDQKYIVLDPLIGKRTISAMRLLKSWQDAGGYYLAIFN